LNDFLTVIREVTGDERGEMGKLSDAKMLGGIGSILQIIPYLNIVGFILTLIAVKFVSDEVHDGSIFTDMLYAVIAGIVGFAIAAVGIFGAILSIAAVGVAAFAGIAVFLVVAWLSLIVSSIFIRRAFDKMATKLNVGTFRTAGMLYFVGALLTIVLVGFVILFIAFILQIVAFFSINEVPSQPQGMQATSMAPASAPAQGGTKFCANCGTEMGASVAFCPKCGAKQP
jgi:uncharacterized membrane protein